MPGRAPLVFAAHAMAEPATPPGFDAPPSFEAVMLVEPEVQGGGPAQKVGTSCRICPRAACPARREPSIMAEAF
jgi:hypothetical protein